MQITIDCRELTSRSAVYEAFLAALPFPEDCGRNLDALHDCLTSLPGSLQLTMRHWSDAEARLGNYAMALRQMLTDAAAETPRLNILFS